jgi:hypothetical protein
VKCGDTEIDLDLALKKMSEDDPKTILQTQFKARTEAECMQTATIWCTNSRYWSKSLSNRVTRCVQLLYTIVIKTDPVISYHVSNNYATLYVEFDDEAPLWGK